MSYGYVYKTTNLLNDRVYIGQKKGQFDSNYFGSGLIIRSALSKEGSSNFSLEVLAYGMTRDQLNELEMKFIADYREMLGRDTLYNITDGGVGVRRPCPDLVRQKIRAKVHAPDCTCMSCKNTRKEKHGADCCCVGCRSSRGDSLNHREDCKCIACAPIYTKREVRTCVCGCGGTFECKVSSSKRYIFNHHKRGSTSWNKGRTGLQTCWNKGLTKYTDGRVLKMSNSLTGKKYKKRDL